MKQGHILSSVIAFIILGFAYCVVLFLPYYVVYVRVILPLIAVVCIALVVVSQLALKKFGVARWLSIAHLVALVFFVFTTVYQVITSFVYEEAMATTWFSILAMTTWVALIAAAGLSMVAWMYVSNSSQAR